MAVPSPLELSSLHLEQVADLYHAAEALAHETYEETPLGASAENIRILKGLYSKAQLAGMGPHVARVHDKSHALRIEEELKWQGMIEGVSDRLFAQLDFEGAYTAAVRGWITPPDEPADGVFAGKIGLMDRLRKATGRPPRLSSGKVSEADMAEVEAWGGQRGAMGWMALNAQDPSHIRVLRGPDGKIVSVAAVGPEGDALAVRILAAAPGHGAEMMQALAREAARDGKALSLISTHGAEKFYKGIGMQEAGSGRYAFSVAQAKVFAKTGGNYAPAGEATPMLTQAENLVAQQMIQSIFQGSPAGERMPQTVARALASRVNAEAYQRGAVSQYLGYAGVTSEKAGQISLEHMGLNKTFAWAHPENMARDMFQVRGSKVIQQMYGNHMNKLSKIIVDATNPRSPATVQQVTSRIKQEWPKLRMYQAERIARTETAAVWTATSAAAYEANGIEEWDSLVAHGPSIEADVSGACDFCVEMASERHGIEDDPPPWHPNCRCEMIPVLDREGLDGESIPWLPPEDPWTGGSQGGAREFAPRPVQDIPGPILEAMPLGPEADKVAADIAAAEGRARAMETQRDMLIQQGKQSEATLLGYQIDGERRMIEQWRSRLGEQPIHPPADIPGGFVMGSTVRFNYFGKPLEGEVVGVGRNNPEKVLIRYENEGGNKVMAEALPEDIHKPTAEPPPEVPKPPPQYTGDALPDAGITPFAIEAKALTEEEVFALHSYTKTAGSSGNLGNYDAVNRWLRKLDIRRGKPLAQIKEAVKLLDSAITKAPALEKEVTLWRGVSNPEFYGGVPKVGQSLTDDAFLSTSVTPKLPTSWADTHGDLWEIRVPAGSKGVNINEALKGTPYGPVGLDPATAKEMEIVLARGTKLVVDSVEERVTTYEASGQRIVAHNVKAHVESQPPEPPLLRGDVKPETAAQQEIPVSQWIEPETWTPEAFDNTLRMWVGKPVRITSTGFGGGPQGITEGVLTRGDGYLLIEGRTLGNGKFAEQIEVQVNGEWHTLAVMPENIRPKPGPAVPAPTPTPPASFTPEFSGEMVKPSERFGKIANTRDAEYNSARQDAFDNLDKHFQIPKESPPVDIAVGTGQSSNFSPAGMKRSGQREGAKIRVTKYRGDGAREDYLDSTYHEWAHYLDWSLTKDSMYGTRYASEMHGDSLGREEFAPFLKAARESPEIKEWRAYYQNPSSIPDDVWAPKSHIKYMTSNVEMFARAHAQYMAEITGDAEYMKFVQTHVGMGTRADGTQAGGWYWTPEHFAPIKKELDDLYAKLGVRAEAKVEAPRPPSEAPPKPTPTPHPEPAPPPKPAPPPPPKDEGVGVDWKEGGLKDSPVPLGTNFKTEEGFNRMMASYEGRTVRIKFDVNRTPTTGEVKITPRQAKNMHGELVTVNTVHVGGYRLVRHDLIADIEVKVGGRYKSWSEFEKLSQAERDRGVIPTARGEGGKSVPAEVPVPEGGFKFEDAPPSGIIGDYPATPEFKSVTEARAFAQQFLAREVEFTGSAPDLKGLHDALDGVAAVLRPYGVKLERLHVEKPKGTKALAYYTSGRGTRPITINGKKEYFRGEMIQSQVRLFNRRQMEKDVVETQRIFDSNKATKIAQWERWIEREKTERRDLWEERIAKYEQQMAAYKHAERWYIASADPAQASKALLAHEAGHALSHNFAAATSDDGLANLFQTRMELHGVTPADRIKVSEYAATGDGPRQEPGSEMFAEVTAARVTGHWDLIPKNIQDAYDEVLASITKKDIEERIAATVQRDSFHALSDEEKAQRIADKLAEDAKQQASDMNAVEPMTSLNPTGGVFVKYGPEARATAPLGGNLTTLDKTMGVEPGATITIYRGAPAGQHKIAPGDFVTTNPQLAKDYGETVIEMKVPASHVLDDSSEPLGEEYIYRPPAPDVDTQIAVIESMLRRGVRQGLYESAAAKRTRLKAELADLKAQRDGNVAKRWAAVERWAGVQK